MLNILGWFCCANTLRSAATFLLLLFNRLLAAGIKPKIVMATKAKCSVSYYHQLPDEQLDDFGTGVKEGLANNAVLFPTPPVSAVALQALIDDYEVKRSAYKRGGLDQKPAFELAKTALMNGLDSTAAYVDEIANGSEATIVAGGFIPTKTTRQPVPAPAKPTVVTLQHGQAHGQVIAECKAVSGATYYGCFFTEGTPLPEADFANGQLAMPPNVPFLVGFDFNRDRKKVFNGMQPGTQYYFYFYAANPAGVSALSEPVSIMAV